MPSWPVEQNIYYYERLDPDTVLQLHRRRERFPDAWNQQQCHYEPCRGPWEYGYNIRSGLSAGGVAVRDSDVIWGYQLPEAAREAGREAARVPKEVRGA